MSFLAIPMPFTCPSCRNDSVLFVGKLEACSIHSFDPTRSRVFPNDINIYECPVCGKEFFAQAEGETNATDPRFTLPGNSQGEADP